MTNLDQYQAALVQLEEAQSTALETLDAAPAATLRVFALTAKKLLFRLANIGKGTAS